jgi:hypothetical protein
MTRLLALFLALLGAPALAQTVAITNGKVAIGDGSPPIDGATVLIRHGRIVAAGRNVAIPAGAQQIDAGGKWVTPGIVAGFTQVGLGEVTGVDATNDTVANNSPFSAGIDIAPAVNAASSMVAVTRARGITRALVVPSAGRTIFAGQGAWVDTAEDRGVRCARVPVRRIRGDRGRQVGWQPRRHLRRLSQCLVRGARLCAQPEWL